MSAPDPTEKGADMSQRRRCVLREIDLYREQEGEPDHLATLDAIDALYSRPTPPEELRERVAEIVREAAEAVESEPLVAANPHAPYGYADRILALLQPTDAIKGRKGVDEWLGLQPTESEGEPVAWEMLFRYEGDEHWEGNGEITRDREQAESDGKAMVEEYGAAEWALAEYAYARRATLILHPEETEEKG